jgi:hypothetical protein
MRNYREHERNVMIRRHQAERRERSGGQRTGETWQPDNTTKGAPVQRHPSYNPIAAQAIPFPQPTIFNPTATQPTPPHRRETYAVALAAKPAALNKAAQPTPAHRDQGWSNLEWSIPQDGPLCFAAIKEAPLVEERRLTGVAAWVVENTTYYYPEQEAKARADAEAISEEQARVLEEVRRAEAKVEAEIAARGRGLRRKGFEEVEGIAVGGWAGDGAGGRGGNVMFDGEDATGRRLVCGERSGVGNESGKANANPDPRLNTNADPKPNPYRTGNAYRRGGACGNPGSGRPNVRGGRGNARGGIGTRGGVESGT